MDYESEGVPVTLRSGEVEVEKVMVSGVVGGEKEADDPVEVA